MTGVGTSNAMDYLWRDFYGAAHDFGISAVSMQHQGKSIAEDGAFTGKKGKSPVSFHNIFLVWMVIAVFALVIANLFISFPSSVIPVNFEIIIASFLAHLLTSAVFL